MGSLPQDAQCVALWPLMFTDNSGRVCWCTRLPVISCTRLPVVGNLGDAHSWIELMRQHTRGVSACAVLVGSASTVNDRGLEFVYISLCVCVCVSSSLLCGY